LKLTLRNGNEEWLNGAAMPRGDMHRLVESLRRLLTSPGSGRLVILVGAGMTVPAVSGVARLTRQALIFADQVGQPRPRSDVNEPLSVSLDVQQLRIAHYTEALQAVREVRGRDGLRTYLQEAILHAHEQGPDLRESINMSANFSKLVRKTEGWKIPDGLMLLADLLRTHGGRIHKYLLTTNFDPLLEIALLRAGLRINKSYGVSGPNDAMTGLHGDRSRWTVVHLHGDSQENTLHDPALIGQPHDEVEDWLAGQLRGNRLLVLGYSGWDGLVQRTMTRHFGRDAGDKADQGVEVLWSVYESPADHLHVNAALADFFDRYRLRGVSAYYGIERDRLLRTVHEELTTRSIETTSDRRGSDPDFYRTARQLNQDYDFGLSRLRPETRPAFVFWPHRLRRPHLIHGVHALTAALLSKLGIPVELHLDDTNMTDQFADRTADEFIDAVTAWFEVCGAEQPPTVFRMSTLLRANPPAQQSARLWNIATDWYSATNSAFDALIATKVVSTEGDRVSVGPTQAHRLLRPVYTWLALDDALDRHGSREPDAAAPVTLGGIDEQKMWDLWVARPNTPSVASIFVPRLESPTEGADLWQYSELRRDTPYGARDLERFLTRSADSLPAAAPLLRWIFTAANRLADLASESAVPGLVGANGDLATWREVNDDLGRRPAEVCAALSEVVASWLYYAT
jgi:hypothetical protein